MPPKPWITTSFLWSRHRLQQQWALLVEMGQPPVTQPHGLALDVLKATRKVATRVIMQGLARSLVGERHRHSCAECMVKCLDVARRGGHEHTGAHRYDGSDASLDQTRRHAAEHIIQRTHSTL